MYRGRICYYWYCWRQRRRPADKAWRPLFQQLLVERFHGSNHRPTRIGSPGCCCETTDNVETVIKADMIGFMESVV
jgi:hypothetical protein